MVCPVLGMVPPAARLCGGAAGSFGLEFTEKSGHFGFDGFGFDEAGGEV